MAWHRCPCALSGNQQARGAALAQTSQTRRGRRQGCTRLMCSSCGLGRRCNANSTLLAAAGRADRLRRSEQRERPALHAHTRPGAPLPRLFTSRCLPDELPVRAAGRVRAERRVAPARRTRSRRLAPRVTLRSPLAARPRSRRGASGRRRGAGSAQRRAPPGAPFRAHRRRCAGAFAAKRRAGSAQESAAARRAAAAAPLARAVGARPLAATHRAAAQPERPIFACVSRADACRPLPLCSARRRCCLATARCCTCTRQPLLRSSTRRAPPAALQRTATTGSLVACCVLRSFRREPRSCCPARSRGATRTCTRLMRARVRSGATTRLATTTQRTGRRRTRRSRRSPRPYTPCSWTVRRWDCARFGAGSDVRIHSQLLWLSGRRTGGCTWSCARCRGCACAPRRARRPRGRRWPRASSHRTLRKHRRVLFTHCSFLIAAASHLYLHRRRLRRWRVRPQGAPPPTLAAASAQQR